MKIILDETTKEGILIKEDGTEVSRYSYEDILDEDLTFEDFKTHIEDFNKTLALSEEFDDIEGLLAPMYAHDWND